MKNQNKIMGFLGYHTFKPTYINLLKWDCPKDTPLEDKLKGRFVTGSNFGFDTDWNMLKPVQQHILKVINQVYTDDKYDMLTKFLVSMQNYMFDIEYQYKIVIELIDWYNKNIKND